jgi:MFS family permease
MELAQRPSLVAPPAATVAHLRHAGGQCGRTNTDAPPASGVAPGPSAARWPLRRSLQVVTLGWLFGSVWATTIGGSPTTVFVKGLGGTPLQFGLLAALPFIASLLSLPASLLIERTGRRKAIFLAGLYFQRLLWFPLALVPLWIVSRHGLDAAPAALWVFLALTLVMHGGQAVGGPAWVSWMADVVPDRLRGKYFSRRRQWGIVSAIPTALFVGWLLDTRAVTHDPMTTLRWCAIVFMCAAVFGVVDIAFFTILPAAPKEPRRGAGLLKAMAEPLRNRQFLWFAGFVATLTFAVSFMQQFVTLYLLDRTRVGVSNATTQLMVLVVPMAAQLFVLPAWGNAVDRMGKKPVLALAAAGLVPVAAGWCCLGPNNLWLGYVLAAANAVLWTGVDIANFNLTLEMSGSGDGAKGGGSGGTAYVAVNSVIINVAGCLGGLASGLIAQGLHDWHWAPVAGGKAFGFYEVLFVLSAVLRLAAVVIFLPRIREPAARPAVEALRFMTANLRDQLASVVPNPLRIGRAKRGEPAYAKAA